MRVDVKGKNLDSELPTEIVCYEDISLFKSSKGEVEFNIEENSFIIELDKEYALGIIEGLKLAIDLGWFEKNVKAVDDYRGADAE